MRGSGLISASSVLHCDKESRFCHIEALTVRFLVQALIVSGDNGLNHRSEFEEAEVSSLQGAYQRRGIFERMSVNRKMRAFAAGVLLLSALALGGCSMSIADLPLVGTPADAPERPKEAGAYLPVHDLPPDRQEAALAPAERAKIAAELAAARDRQGSTAAPKDSAAK